MAHDLDALLAQASAAGPGDRIRFRDQLAAHGSVAIPFLAEWLVDARLGAFAVRVLERIGRDHSARVEVIRQLARGRSLAPSDSVRRDIDDALGQLKPSAVELGARRRPAEPGARPVGLEGKPGRGYWATHTWERDPERGPKQRAYVWAEIRRGRLRQGWGWDANQDLREIVRQREAGLPLNREQQAAWRARRMLTSQADGIRYDDVVVAVAVPEPWQVAVVRVIGPYEFDIDPAIRDYGHLLPIELLTEPIDRHGPLLSDALEHALKGRLRLWRIDGVGGDIEQVLVEGK